MIEIRSITLKNFLSIGAVAQTVSFDRKNLTLIIGENLDLGGNGSRNGVGKSALLQAISYALFGQALANIKKDNLINKTNERNMTVSIDFTVNGAEYRILRGRRPNVLKFYVNNCEQEVAQDDSQGDSRETQHTINRILCMDADMFQQIIGLNSNGLPFLSMKVSDQRAIIEQLLGITLLSDKAEVLKQLNKTVKDRIGAAEIDVKSREAANKRIQEQIDSLSRRQRLWHNKRDGDLAALVSEWDSLSAIDIEAEFISHAAVADWLSATQKQQHRANLLGRQSTWLETQQREIVTLNVQLDELKKIDIAREIENHGLLEAHNTARRENLKYVEDLHRAKTHLQSCETIHTRTLNEITQLAEHKCYACGQGLHDEKHAHVLAARRVLLEEAEKNLQAARESVSELLQSPPVVPQKPHVHYKTLSEAFKHSGDIDKITQQISTKLCEVDPYADQISEIELVDLGAKPKTHYDTLKKAVEHDSRVKQIITEIEAKHREVDPYSEQITEMTNTALQVVDYTLLNELTTTLQHQEYLLDLLTNKRSFVRKRIIQTNLVYLNTRLGYYLSKLGLGHKVEFLDDLSVSITDLGRDLDFDNLSRGERTRVVLSLNLAMRDTFSNLYSPINLLFVDEVLDSGLDTVGVENAVSLFKDMARRRSTSVFLVSHREELISRVSSVLKVVKEGGFTSFENGDDLI